MAVDFRESFHLWLLVASIIIFLQGAAHAWTYNYSSGPNQRWPEARQWCQKYFTDIVAIHNQEEARFLENLLPYNPKYYWIGVLKVAEAWTWVETDEIIPEEAQQWAPGEPDNIAGQECVEMYIKRDTDTTKWNNEKCRNKKGTVCYAASCTRDSCSDHADCVETVGNYTCKCHPGFQGPLCEEAIPCKALPDLEQGSQHCFHSFGSNRFNSSCHFHCKLGFQLVGATQLLCQASGIWDHPVPLCEARQCPTLNSLPHGSFICSHPHGEYSFGSNCNANCEEGFILNGTAYIECTALGTWSTDVPICLAKKCPFLSSPPHGSLVCSDLHGEFSFGSQCTSKCEEGFVLHGTADTECTSQSKWSKDIPQCQARRCPSLISLSHGSFICSHPHGEFRFGSQCLSSCEEGFTLNGTANTNCTSLGMWSSRTPQCLALRCPLLAEAPQYGKINCRDPNAAFSFGSRCDFECSDGFQLQGASTVICNMSGLWSQDLPTCQPVRCKVISTLSSLLSMNCSHPVGNFSFGSQCIFTCNKGFSLNGTAELTCSSTGSWNDNLPQCLGMSTMTTTLLYSGVGATSLFMVLTLVGLVLLVMTRFKRKGETCSNQANSNVYMQLMHSENF